MENPDYALYLRKCVTYAETLKELLGESFLILNITPVILGYIYCVYPFWKRLKCTGSAHL